MQIPLAVCVCVATRSTLHSDYCTEVDRCDVGDIIYFCLSVCTPIKLGCFVEGKINMGSAENIFIRPLQ